MPIVLEAEVKKKRLLSMNIMRKIINNLSKIGLRVSTGAVHSDADSFFGALYAQDNVESLLCNAHARRKFEAIAKTTKKKGLAHHAMSVYAKIYQVERKMKAEKRSFEEIKSMRQEKTLPLLNNFKQWCDEKQPLVPQKSPIAKAINYTLRH